MKAVPICCALLASVASARAETVRGFRAEKFAGLRFEMPARWERAATEPSEEFEMGVWQAGTSQIVITRWPGPPRLDGSVMVIARRWPITVAGQKTALVQTTHFQSTRAQVLVCFWKRGHAQFRVLARKTGPRELTAILRSVKFEEAT